jgi:excisionase family DNA binding protein
MTEDPETQAISSRMTIPEIARRLNIGRLAVYAMLEQGLLPGIRIGRRWGCAMMQGSAMRRRILS